MLAQRPPMGWNSWNTFGNEVCDRVIRDTADAFIEKGLKDAGYEYVVIDDCWSLYHRDENGRLVADPEKFPNGMKSVADYVHSKGLKFGMYSCAGTMTCAGRPSSFEHEFEDAKQFADWGVDFLKYDYCNKPDSANGPLLYNRMSMALKATGREILFSACNWGADETENWIRSTGAHMYRSTGDIEDCFISFKNIAMSQIDKKKLPYSGPGCYNDVDMLICGMHGKGNVANGGCTDSEYRMHFALWCMMQSPLMIGGDICNMDDFNLELLKNKELIAIDQDEEARPPLRLGNDSCPILFKHLSGGEYAIAFLNFNNDHCREIALNFYDIGLNYASGYGFNLRDIFTGEEVVTTDSYMQVKVNPRDCRIFRGTLVKR